MTTIPAARPAFSALMPLIGTGSAIIALLGVGLTAGATAMMSVM